MTTNIGTGTVLITGPTSGLGRALRLELAGRAERDRPDLLLVGRPGERLTEITSLVRADGATAEAVPVLPDEHGRERELRPWEATNELVKRSAIAS